MIDISKVGTFAGPNPVAAPAGFLRESDVTSTFGGRGGRLVESRLN